jgi:hypothetical protein
LQGMAGVQYVMIHGRSRHTQSMLPPPQLIKLLLQNVLFFSSRTPNSSIGSPILCNCFACKLCTIPSIFHPLSIPYDSASASLAALLARFSNKLSLLDAKIVCCLCSTPVNQYPKLPPTPAKTGHAHSDSLLKKGRISRPSCQKRTATPIKLSQVSIQSSLYGVM